MGRYMRKCKEIGELAVMEVSQVVGVTTRARTVALAAAAAVVGAGGASSKRRRATPPGELQISYLQLRSRSLVMSTRITRSLANSSSARRLSPERGRISRCSSNASCEVLDEDEQEPRWRSANPEDGEGLETVECHFEFSRNRRDTTASSNWRDESVDLESTAERKTMRSVLTEPMPSEAEMDDFFATAERAAKRRFTDRYNFDVDSDAPLDGRYEWTPLKACKKPFCCSTAARSLCG